MKPFKFPLADFTPALIIFDKDGTLIDFHAMWGGWLTDLGQRLDAAAGVAITDPLCKAMDFDAANGRIAPHGQLALTPMAELRALTSAVLLTVGLSPSAAEATLKKVWQPPDPVVLAQPVTDLTDLFTALHTHGLKVAIATSDDRLPTETWLAEMGLASLLDGLVCADDGLPLKPASDMVHHLCRALDIPPYQTVMVGDNVVDLQMGRAAGVGLTIGVLSGLGSAEDLEPYADVLLASVAALLKK